MSGYGFGPLGARASTVRPSPDTDGYGVQTWFKNCSAPGAADGTVPTAGWFNLFIGNFVYAANQADVALANENDDDTTLWTIIQNAITQRLASTSLPWGL